MPDRIEKTSYNNGWTSGNGWKPSLQDVAIRDMSAPIVKDKIGYIKSPEYRRRLVAMGEDNPDQLIKDRASGLMNIQFFSGQPGSSSTNKSYTGAGADVQVASGAGLDTISHELGHVTSGLNQVGKSMNNGQSGAMSPAEAWFLINKDRRLSVSQKSDIDKWFRGDIKQFGQYMVDPAKRVLSNMDPHDVSSVEAKGDIDAMRYLLKDRGFTQKYGQDINIDTFKKALLDKNFSDNKFIKRLRSRFTDNDIISINNTIAYTQPSGGSVNA